jgi:hypothetical protein
MRRLTGLRVSSPEPFKHCGKLGLNILLASALLASCRPGSTNTIFSQRGYLWQRDWTPAVAAAVTAADRQMDGVVVLAAEIQWNAGRPSPTRANLSWHTLKSLKKPISLALRIDPY